jgi:hypothetical protein
MSLRLIFVLLALSAGFARARTTEVPHTVAPGRFLIEMDALSLTFDREGGDRLTAVAAASTFLSTGLTPYWDAQIGVELFLSQRITSGGLKERNSGLGDLFVRSKYTFYEDESLGVSAAVIPYLKLPTKSGGVGNDSVEGGLIVPWEADLGSGAILNVMAGLDLARNDADDGYDSYWYASSSVGIPLTGAFSAYGEAYVAKSSGGAPWEGVLGAGLAYSINEFMSWDFAVYRGLSDGAADWNPVVRFNFEF